MRAARVAGLATEGPQAYETRRERLSWWTGWWWGLALGIALGLVGVSFLLCGIAERVAGVAP